MCTLIPEGSPGNSVLSSGLRMNLISVTMDNLPNECAVASDSFREGKGALTSQKGWSLRVRRLQSSG